MDDEFAVFIRLDRDAAGFGLVHHADSAGFPVGEGFGPPSFLDGEARVGGDDDLRVHRVEKGIAE